MALTAKLELRQSQQLVMTPQLQQAIKLLQLSNMELNAFVESELEKNPLLERDDDGPAAPSAPDIDRGPDDSGPERLGAESEPDLDLHQQSAAATSDLDADFDNVFEAKMAGVAFASVGAHFSAACARLRAASTNCGSFSVTSAWSGVFVRSRRMVQLSRLGALKSSSDAGGALRFQKV